MIRSKCFTVSRRLSAVLHLIVVLVVAAAAPGLRAEVYECVDANGSYRYTNVILLARGCKFLNVLPPDSFPAAESQANVVATSPTTDLAALTTVRDAAPPATRLQAIEDWARGSRDALDPVTYALVDPDESVRARAQELWEETLQRR
jgi:hypothetical protein